MKLAGIIFLIATIVYFLIKWKKAGNIKSETNKTSTKNGDEKKKTDDNAGGTEYWKKNRKSLIIWVIILQFIVLNLIYPGEWFEVKKIFWFFAPRVSGKYVAIKEHEDIIEKDKKKKLSDIQAEIKKFEQTKDLNIDDIKKLNDLKKKAEKINDVYSGYSETKAAKPASVSAKPETKEEESKILLLVNSDLLTGAYLRLVKPPTYAGKNPEDREIVFEVKISVLTAEKIQMSNDRGFEALCNWKNGIGRYQGRWKENEEWGFIELTPIYKNGSIERFCGAIGRKNGKLDADCLIQATIL